jgi:hypothetical protein
MASLVDFLDGRSVFPELFAHRRLVDDLLLTASIEEFLDLLAAVTIAGRELATQCSEQFLAANSLRGRSPQDLSFELDMARSQARIHALLDAFKCEGSAAHFLAFVRDFLDALPEMANFVLADPARQSIEQEALARMFDYMRTLNLFASSGKNVLEFCASSQVFSFLAGVMGHNVINTDIGGALDDEWYGFGGKIFVRNAFLGSRLLNYKLDFSLNQACAVPWFKNGVDVIAIHGTYLRVGERTATGPATAAAAADMDRSVGEMMNFLEPALSALRQRGGLLSLRHVWLFKGYGASQKAALHAAVAEKLRNANVKPILCGFDPYPSPWAADWEGEFTDAVVLQC